MEGILQRRKAMQMQWMEKSIQCEWKGIITIEEIEKHCTLDDCWNIIGTNVYDMTQYVKFHPGGTSVFISKRNLTEIFHKFHPHLDLEFVKKLKIGTIKG